MVKIPVIVVDDNQDDRYIAKRKLSKHDDFAEVLESNAGYSFLEDYFEGTEKTEIEQPPLVVLMDINMPRMNGFETVAEIHARVAEGRGPDRIVVIMFSSSDNPEDHKEAEILQSVQGYVVKPLNDSGIEQIRAAYHNAA